jgi:hypothetical protein
MRVFGAQSSHVDANRAGPNINPRALLRIEGNLGSGHPLRAPVPSCGPPDCRLTRCLGRIPVPRRSDDDRQRHHSRPSGDRWWPVDPVTAVLQGVSLGIGLAQSAALRASRWRVAPVRADRSPAASAADGSSRHPRSQHPCVPGGSTAHVSWKTNRRSTLSLRKTDTDTSRGAPSIMTFWPMTDRTGSWRRTSRLIASLSVGNRAVTSVCRRR